MVEGKRHWKTKTCLIVSIGTGFQKHVDFIGDTETTTPTTARASIDGSQSPEQDVEVDLSRVGSIINGLWEAWGIFGGTLKTATQPVTDKAAQIARIPGGLKTVTRILDALVTLSTNSESTHRRIWEEAHSEDEYLQFPYFRFNVPRGMEGIGLEEWKMAEKMTALTRSYLESPDVKKEMQRCARALWIPSTGLEST